MVLSILLARIIRLDKTVDVSSGQTMIVRSVSVFLLDENPPALKPITSTLGFHSVVCISNPGSLTDKL